MELFGAIVLPTQPPSVKFTITSTTTQLLNVKGMYRGATDDDANKHLINFEVVHKSQDLSKGKIKQH